MRWSSSHAMLAGALLAGAGALGACRRAASPLASIETAPVVQQDIVVNVEATGVIEPVDAVQVKSKASGQIVTMPVVVGSRVRQGDLLVQVDPRQMQSQYDAAVAALKAAQQNLAVQTSQLAREDSLFRQRVITAVEHETAAVAYANALAAVASAENSVQISSINLADATVLAPVSGTVIDKNVSLGQVIASATNVVGGGTALLTVADLSRVLDSALVNESDIGRVKVGQEAAVTVDAYPTRTFRGQVLRISPQAIVQQSVTMFPVLVSLDNREGLLMPGMSTDATIDVTRLVGVVAVPNDALGSLQEGAALATVLGISAAADSVLAAARSGPVLQAGAPAASRATQTGRRGARSAGAPSGATPGATAGAMAGATAGAMAGATTTRSGIVFVQDTTTRTFALRVVVLGGGNYEVTQVTAGVQPGERVALLSDVRMAAARDTTRQRVQSRSGISGMTGGQGAGGGRGGQGGGRGGAH